MPVLTQPYQHDNSIIIYSFEGDWTWEQFYTVDTIVSENFADTRADLILDMGTCDTIPNGINEILHRIGQRSSGAHGGLGILVNAPLSLQVIVRALKRMYTKKSRRYAFVETFDEALAMIYDSRQTSPPENV